MSVIKMSPERYLEIRNTSFGKFLHKNKLLSELLRYVYDESFDNIDMEKNITSPMPDIVNYKKNKEKAFSLSTSISFDISKLSLKDLYGSTFFNKEQEHHVFRKMNFLKYKCCRLLEKNCLTRLDKKKALKYLRKSVAIKKMIAQSNTRLCFKFSKKIAQNANMDMHDLLSLAYESCMIAISCFEFNRGFRFSTYVTTSICRRLQKESTRYNKNKYRYSDFTEMEEVFLDTEEFDRELKESSRVDDIKEFVKEIVGKLDSFNSRYGDIIKKMFLSEKKNTLNVISEELGISKERVRQIKEKAIKFLKEISISQYKENNKFKVFVKDMIERNKIASR